MFAVSLYSHLVHAIVMKTQLITRSLNEALKYTANPTQAATLSHYISAFRTGSMTAYHASQKTWVQDSSPPVEHVLGFVDSYTDPYGVRAQFEGAVCIADERETSRMKAFVEKASYFATLLPWATPENNGKGPFEKDILTLPNFQILHGMYPHSSYMLAYSHAPQL